MFISYSRANVLIVPAAKVFGDVPSTLLTFIKALEHSIEVGDISSNSWGPGDDGVYLYNVYQEFIDVAKKGITQVRLFILLTVHTII